MPQRLKIAIRDVRRAAGIRQMSGAGYVAAWAGTARHLIRPRRTILFMPQRPLWLYMVYKLCALQGYRVETNPRRPHDLVFRFRDATFDDSTLPPEPGMRVINGEMRDVSKERVQESWVAAAGYPLAVDPFTHVGPAVCKANANARHNGQVVECPLSEIRDDSVYERLIDNTSAPGEVMEYRVPIHGDRIPLVYMKYRPVDKRFDPRLNTRVDVTSTAAAFTGAEQATLLRCARVMGLDFGDMDVLRDTRDGRIYAVDVNNTPCGPPSPLTVADKAHALSVLAESFRRFIECPGQQ